MIPIATNGINIHGAYYCPAVLGEAKPDNNIENLKRIPVEITSYQTGRMEIWAHNGEEAGEIAAYLTENDIKTYAAPYHTGIRAEYKPDTEKDITETK